MRNDEVIAVLPQLAKRQARAAELRKIARSSSEEAQRLEDENWQLEQVTKIIDGIALTYHDNGFIEAVGEDITRCASIYLNAHNQTTYGLHTYTDAFGRAGELWHGADFASEQAANSVALDWIIRGQRPAR
jgi:hypothetical protein